MSFITTNKYHNCCPYCRTKIKGTVRDVSLATKVKNVINEREFDSREVEELSSGIYKLPLPPTKIANSGCALDHNFLICVSANLLGTVTGASFYCGSILTAIFCIGLFMALCAYLCKIEQIRWEACAVLV